MGGTHTKMYKSYSISNTYYSLYYRFSHVIVVIIIIIIIISYDNNSKDDDDVYNKILKPDWFWTAIIWSLIWIL